MFRKSNRRQLLAVALTALAGAVVLMKLYEAVLLPIGISLFLSFVLLPLVDRFDARGFPRWAVVSAILGVTLFALGFAVVRFLPSLYAETLALIKLAPSVYESVSHTWIPYIRGWVSELGWMNSEDFEAVWQKLQQFSLITDRIPQAVATLWYSAPVVLNLGISIVLVPMLTFFLLKDQPLYGAYFVSLVPPELRQPTEMLKRRLAKTLRAVISGQVLVATVLGTLYVVGLNIVGIYAATVIGLVAGTCRLIPYLDIVVGVFLSLIVILSDFQGPHQIIGVALVFTVVQSLDGMFITPRIIGERAGIHPVIVILSIISFGDTFGFLGVLLAIPIVAVAKQILLVVKESFLEYGSVRE
ncbi:MAG: AI-2E family transporter [Zetaproteobacteria bacterium]|nr:AI-2E family transporter [Zetaproteobacteria bacterium]